MNTTRTRKTDTVAVAASVKRTSPVRAKSVPSEAPPEVVATTKRTVRPSARSARTSAVTQAALAAAAGSTAPVKSAKAAPVGRSLKKAVGTVAAKAKASAPSIDVRVRDAVIARLDSMKANDMLVIDVRGKTSLTDVLVIVSGTSTRHVKSMGNEVVETAKNLGMSPLGVEGEREAEWILVDLGDTIIHLMLPRTREFYGLERLWTVTSEWRAAMPG